MGRFVGSCCQQVVVNSHSSLVYPREVAKSGLLGLVPLIIRRTTDQELHSWNGRLSVRTWEEVNGGVELWSIIYLVNRHSHGVYVPSRCGGFR